MEINNPHSIYDVKSSRTLLNSSQTYEVAIAHWCHTKVTHCPKAFRSDTHVRGVLNHLSLRENARANDLHDKVLSTSIKVMHPLTGYMLKGIMVDVL